MDQISVGVFVVNVQNLINSTERTDMGIVNGHDVQLVLTPGRADWNTSTFRIDIVNAQIPHYAMNFYFTRSPTTNCQLVSFGSFANVLSVTKGKKEDVIAVMREVYKLISFKPLLILIDVNYHYITTVEQCFETIIFKNEYTNTNKSKMCMFMVRLPVEEPVVGPENVQAPAVAPENVQPLARPVVLPGEQVFVEQNVQHDIERRSMQSVAMAQTRLEAMQIETKTRRERRATQHGQVEKRPKTKRSVVQPKNPPPVKSVQPSLSMSKVNKKTIAQVVTEPRVIKSNKRLWDRIAPSL